MQRPRVLQASSPPTRRRAGIDRALQFLFCIVFVGAIYRYCWIDASDLYKCGALLHEGAWLDLGLDQKDPSSFQSWQPPGCLMHEYKKADISQCLQERRLVFIGDSTVRQVFWAVAEKSGEHRPKVETRDAFEPDYVGEDIEIESAGVETQFIWDPWLNSTKLEQELEHFEIQPPADGRDESAALILVGAPGLSYARHGKVNYFHGFRSAVDRIIPYMDHTPTSNNTGQTELRQPFDKPANILLLSPIQDPMYQDLSPANKAEITFSKIHMMNEYLHQSSAYSSADVIWSYSLMTEAGSGAYADDGLHVIQSLAERKADILLNLRCNGDAAARGYPYNRTCCNNYSRPNIIQRGTLLLALLVLPVLLFLRRWHILEIGSILPAEVCSAIATSALVICFCFFADRTQLFEKAPVQLNGWSFGGACVAVAVAGMLSAKQGRRSTTPNDKQGGTYEGSSLPQNQTDEWKGLAIAFILIYHYTGASEIIWAYKLARILTAFYLFAMIYEHVLSSLTTRDYSIRSAVTVLVRFNIISSILPFMMRTDSALYYLPLLSSFWVMVSYSVLRIGSGSNSSLNFVLAKIIISIIATTAFITISGPLELMFAALQRSCRITWDANLWRLTASLDIYIPYIGMISAILCHRLSLLSSAAQSLGHPIDDLLRFSQTRRALFQNLAIVVSAILAIFWAFIMYMLGSNDYDQWHPYVSWIPISSMLMLRISRPYFRSVRCRLFAWLGCCSLELYILHHHIWLAADSSGLLRIGLWSSWVESAVLTLLFLWLSCRTAEASQELTAWITESRVLAREVGEYESLEAYDSDNIGVSLGTEDEAILMKPISGDEAGLLPRAVNGSKGGLSWTLMVILGLLWAGNWVYR